MKILMLDAFELCYFIQQVAKFEEYNIKAYVDLMVCISEKNSFIFYQVDNQFVLIIDEEYFEKIKPYLYFVESGD